MKVHQKSTRGTLLAGVAVLLVGVFGTGDVQAATTWYQKATVTTANSTALTALSFWTKDGGVSTGSGTPTVNDELIGYNNWVLRFKGATCPAKSLQLGTADTYCQVINDYDSGKALTTTFQNVGLKLFKGMWSFNANGKFVLAGPITVLSTSTDPFAFACGNYNYTGNTETLSGPISGAAGTSLILGKSRMSNFDSAKQTTFCLTGDLAGYAGTLDVQANPTRITKVNGTDYGTRLKLATTTSPCAVNVGRGCVLSACDSGSVTTVSSVNFETGTRYEPVVTGHAISCLNVTDALTLAEPIEVYLDGSLQRSGPTRLPILTAPATMALSERDFLFRAGPNCDSIGISLRTETDPGTGKWTLYVVDPRSADATVWYQKAAVTGGNTAALTDLSFWTKDGGATAGSGTPTANDELIGYNNWRLRFKGATCPAKSLQLGTAGTYCEVIDDYDSGRAYTTTFQNDGLKLVKGVWSFNANVGLTIAGPITVFSPSTDAFAFSYCNSTYTGNTATVSGPISGAAGTSLILGKSGSSFDSAKQTTFRLTGDLSGYAGTLDIQAHPSRITKVNGADYGTRLKLSTTTSPCSVNVGKGCVLGGYQTSSTTTVARVRFDTGTRYEPAGGEYAMSCLKVTESLELAGPVEFYFNTTLRGTKQQYRLPVLMAPASSTFTVDDFNLVIGGTLYNLDLHLEVGIDPETGMRTLYVVTWGFTIQKSSYNKEGQRDTPNPNVSSLTNAAAWWDGEVPHAGAAYRLANMALRTLYTPNEDYTFPGVSLWLQNSAQLLLSVKSFSVPTFYASGTGTGAMIGVTSAANSKDVFPGSTVKADRFVFSDTVILRAHASHYLTLEGEIEGDADLKLSGWSGTGYPAAFYELNGNNEKFTGTVLVTQEEYRPDYATFESGFPTLYVNDGLNLGGLRPEFTPRALTLTHQARLSVSNNVTVTLADDLNRGVYVLEKGRFHAKEAESVLEVLQPVLLSGHLWTEGDGLVVLGGPMTFEASDGGEIVDTPRSGSNLVTVASALVAAHPDCLNGCDVTIADGGRLILDVDKLGATGLDLTRPGSALNLDASFGGRLPLFVTTTQPAPENPTEPTIISLMTVSDGEMVTAVRAMLRRIPRVWPNVSQRVVEIHDAAKGQTTFALDIQDRGMMMIIK